MASAIILLSAGLDSTVNLFRARRDHNINLALSFNYGQKAAAREMAHSKKIADEAGVAHQIIELPWLKAITATSLVNSDSEIPTGSEVSIDDLETSENTAAKVWVPNRNGVFLNIAASFAESFGAEYVITGFNKEEAATFPDNTKEFLEKLDESFSYSTATQVKTLCYTTDMDKTEIVKLGMEVNAPFDLMWSCYFTKAKPCGECESCQRFERAKKEAGIE